MATVTSQHHTACERALISDIIKCKSVTLLQMDFQTPQLNDCNKHDCLLPLYSSDWS